MNNRKLPDRYSDLRNEKGLSQTELANKLNYNKQLISKLESGERSLSMAMLKAYADFFYVTTDYLLGLTGIKTKDMELKAVCEYIGLNEEAVENLHKYKTKVKDQYMHSEIDENGEPCLVTSDIGISCKGALEIINELIANEDIYTLAEHLHDLKYDSQRYFEDIDTIKTAYQDDKRSETTKKSIYSHYKKDIDRIAKEIKIDRYELTEFIVHLSDRYDQREQVKSNGKHNPKKK